MLDKISIFRNLWGTIEITYGYEAENCVKKETCFMKFLFKKLVTSISTGVLVMCDQLMFCSYWTQTVIPLRYPYWKLKIFGNLKPTGEFFPSKKEYHQIAVNIKICHTKSRFLFGVKRLAVTLVLKFSSPNSVWF